MNIISLNGKWTCKPDHGNLGIVYKCYSPNNHSIDDSNLLDINIPKSFNLLENFGSFEGIFWHFYEFDLEGTIETLNFAYILRFKGSNYNNKGWLNGRFIGEYDRKKSII